MWTIEPLLDHEHCIIFNIRKHEQGSVLNSTIPEVINVTLISAQLDTNMFTGNLTSVITIKVTNNNVGKRVYCSDGQRSEDDPPSLVIPDGCKLTQTAFSASNNLFPTALPSVPVLTIFNVTYKIEEYFAVLKWHSPRDDGPEVTNYTITLQDEDDVIHSEIVSKDVLECRLYQNYSTKYSFSLYATNCKGSSNSTSFTMFEG